MRDDREGYREQDYWADVRVHAQEVRRLVTEEGMDEHDAIHQEVDGSQWAIYYYRARLVCIYSKNEGEIMNIYGDMGDALSDCRSVSEVYARIAFFALERDVQEAYQALVILEGEGES